MSEFVLWAFIFEAAIKLYALGLVWYFSSGMNCLDFFIVVVSSLHLLPGVSIENVSVVRLLRVGMKLVRVLRAAKSLSGTRRIVDSILFSASSLLDIALLLLLLLFIYAVVGVTLFFNVAERDGVSEHANFRTFGAAMLTVMRVASGADWHGLMDDCSATRCFDPAFEGSGCGDAILGRLYFWSLVFSGHIVVSNLFVAVMVPLRTFHRAFHRTFHRTLH